MAVFRSQSLALRVTFANSSKSNQKCRALLTQPCGLPAAILSITSVGGPRLIHVHVQSALRAIHGALDPRLQQCLKLSKRLEGQSQKRKNVKT